MFNDCNIRTATEEDGLDDFWEMADESDAADGNCTTVLCVQQGMLYRVNKNKIENMLQKLLPQQRGTIGYFTVTSFGDNGFMMFRKHQPEGDWTFFQPVEGDGAHPVALDMTFVFKRDVYTAHGRTPPFAYKLWKNDKETFPEIPAEKVVVPFEFAMFMYVLSSIVGSNVSVRLFETLFVCL